MYCCNDTSVQQKDMITSKKTQEIQPNNLMLSEIGYLPLAFSAYINLLNDFDSRDLVLMESLGPSSNETKISLIGINPVLNIKIFDTDVVITGNEFLLIKIRSIYSTQNLEYSSTSLLQYKLNERKGIWDFLRLLDHEFKQVEGGILAFTTFAYNTIHFIETISGYEKGDLPDISITFHSTYIEFTRECMTIHEYCFVGAKSISIENAASYLQFKNEVEQPFAITTFVVDRETTKTSYLEKAELGLMHVQIGDVYQIQIGQRITISSEIQPLDVYARLRMLNPSPYMYLFDCGGHRIIGASPESFVVMNDDEVVMRPIAGTIGKSNEKAKCDAIKEFESNPKEIAEHMMLVDLCRNDLCKVSLPSSLKVPELMSVEEYSHVYHMVSVAKSKARAECDKFDVIKACFPAGTMTGTPKIRAIELITEIEDSARGMYAGALGVIGLGTNYINTALCIRTAIERDGVFSLRASAGIVSDSIIESEYLETLQKMGSVFKAITNEEISCHIE